MPLRFFPDLTSTSKQLQSVGYRPVSDFMDAVDLSSNQATHWFFDKSKITKPEKIEYRTFKPETTRFR